MMDEDSSKERKLRILAVVGLAICIVALWLPMVTGNVYKGIVGVGFFALLVDFRPILVEEHRLYRVV